MSGFTLDVLSAAAGVGKDAREIQAAWLRAIRAIPAGTVPRESQEAMDLTTAIGMYWRGSTNADRNAALNELDRVLKDPVLDGAAERESSSRRGKFEDLITDGWFRGLLDFMSVGKSAPQFSFVCALTYVAASLGRRPLIPWGALASGLYPNLYTLMVGGSGSGKGSALDHVAAIVVPAGAPHILPNEGSASGFAKALMERYEEMEDQADGLIVAEEFRVLLSEDRYKQQIVTWLTQWYQWSGPWKRALSSMAPPDFENPCVSIIAGSNMAWLRRVPEDAILGGFFPRMFVVECTQEEERWGVAFPKFDMELRAGLTETLGESLRDVPDELKWSKPALEWWDDWYDGSHRRNFQRHSDEQMRYFLSRKQSLAMKVAAIWHLVDNGGGTVDAAACENAMKVLDWCDRSVSSVYEQLSVSKEGAIVNDVLRVVEKFKGVVEDRVVKRHLRNKYKAFNVGQSLEALAYEGELRKVEKKGRVVWETLG